MYKPRRIKTELRTNLGILVLIPNKVITDVIIIGPKNQAKGRLKWSANKAAGTDTSITTKNSLENICLKFSLLKGRAWLFCILNEYWFFRNWTYYIFNN